MVEIYLTPQPRPGVPSIVIEDPGEALALIEALVQDREEVMMVVMSADGSLVGIVSFEEMTLADLVSDPDPMLRLLEVLGGSRVVVGVSLSRVSGPGRRSDVVELAVADRDVGDELERRLNLAGVEVEGWAHLDVGPGHMGGGRFPIGPGDLPGGCGVA